MIVCGTNGNSLRRRFLRQSDLTLPKAISAGYATEEARKHVRVSQMRPSVCTRF